MRIGFNFIFGATGVCRIHELRALPLESLAAIPGNGDSDRVDPVGDRHKKRLDD